MNEDDDRLFPAAVATVVAVVVGLAIYAIAYTAWIAYLK
jgi:hypothetical protein